MRLLERPAVHFHDLAELGWLVRLASAENAAGEPHDKPVRLPRISWIAGDGKR